MTDLVEFLTARLDELERDADRLHDIDCDIHPGFADERGDCDCGEPARLRTDIETKRRIVEHAEVVHERAKVGPSEGDGAWFLILRHLATAFAGYHPDYDESWRP